MVKILDNFDMIISVFVVRVVRQTVLFANLARYLTSILQLLTEHFITCVALSQRNG